MATWPSTILIGRGGYKETPPDRVIRSEMGVGPDKIRRRSSSEVRKMSLNLTLTDALLTDLDTFYTSNDSTSFIFTHPRTDAVVNARFTEAPEYNYRETIWDVSIQLEILP